jgi:hypothetical protein
MNKDVIYIDVEDDITAIIGKIKASSERIVALVPPKRIGTLQSAVNLRLLARMADGSNKRLVIITNNKALIALSAMAKIPIARNLQSKPEIAEIAALEIDDGEDVIDGSQLPIGELARTADSNQGDDVAEVIDTIDIENESRPPLKTASKSSIKVPDFSRFRKKLFIGVALGVLLIAFLVWAIQLAPAATVIIAAKTSPAPVSLSVKLGGTAATDISKDIIQSVSKQIKKDVSVDFTATGQKDVGAKASGSVTISNCDYQNGFTLPAGTQFTTDSGKVFVSIAAVSVPAYTAHSSSLCKLDSSSSGEATVQVQASASGEAYNNSGVSYTIDPDLILIGSKVDAVGTAMTGGTTKVVTVVTADDIQKASQTLADLSSDSVKQQLIKQFANGESVIADSFNVDHAAAVSVPAIDAEATGGKAKLTSSTTFSMTAVAKSEIETYLKDAVNKQISGNNQRIYNDGINNSKLSGYFSNDQGATININATGQIGPNINDASIKQQVKGKQFGDAQALLNGIKGVDNVDIKFSYFWVNTVPTDVNKIDVQFVIQNA